MANITVGGIMEKSTALSTLTASVGVSLKVKMEMYIKEIFIMISEKEKAI